MNCKYLGVAMVYYYSTGTGSVGECEILKLGEAYYTLELESVGGYRGMEKVYYTNGVFHKVRSCEKNMSDYNRIP